VCIVSTVRRRFLFYRFLVIKAAFCQLRVGSSTLVKEARWRRTMRSSTTQAVGFVDQKTNDSSLSFAGESFGV